ncbi:hypothetical protein B0O80DRAFT_305170 [Mortierella sp. GBAus27b]|nr:hypothetical protein B0O80DRAFT_305170 [Mortierella sp. GBAus27b]
MTPRGVMMSEEGLMNALWTRGTKEYLCDLVGDRTNTVQGAQDCVITNKGALLKGLFSMRGFRGTGLQQEYNVPPGHLPETTSICDQETNNDSTPGHSMPVHNDSQVESDIDTPSLSIRRLLRPVIVTDGHFLNLCVFDTRYLRPRRNKGTDSNTDSAVETEDQNEDEFSDLMNHIDDDLDVESPFLPTIDDDSQDIMEITEEITMEDSGDNNNRNEGCNTATEQPSSHTSGTINWAQRSKDLENVSKVLMDSDVCETFRKGPRIGIDPGIKVPDYRHQN